MAKIFVVSGPSGAGKDAIIQQFEQHPQNVIIRTASTAAKAAKTKVNPDKLDELFNLKDIPSLGRA